MTNITPGAPQAPPGGNTVDTAAAHGAAARGFYIVATA